MKFTKKLFGCLCLSALLGCGEPIDIAVDTSSAIAQPPPPKFCEPGEDPKVTADLVGECTAMTQGFGDWYLSVVQWGEETLGWKF